MYLQNTVLKTHIYSNKSNVCPHVKPDLTNIMPVFLQSLCGFGSGVYPVCSNHSGEGHPCSRHQSAA